MNEAQRNALVSIGTDVDNAIYRFGGNAELYDSCLKVFLEDDSMPVFHKAFSAGEWEKATAAIHTLKGVAGNMGFIPLMHAARQTLDLLRAGQYNEAGLSVKQLESEYLSMTAVIRQFFFIPA